MQLSKSGESSHELLKPGATSTSPHFNEDPSTVHPPNHPAGVKPIHLGRRYHTENHRNSKRRNEKGKVSGVSTAPGSLMSILGPLFAGTTYDHVAPFWIGAVVFALAELLLTRAKVRDYVSSQVSAHSMSD